MLEYSMFITNITMLTHLTNLQITNVSAIKVSSCCYSTKDYFIGCDANITHLHFYRTENPICNKCTFKISIYKDTKRYHKIN